MSDDDRIGDGGVVESEAMPEGEPTIADRYRKYSRQDSFVVVTTAIALVFFPLVLVDGLGFVGELIGLSIGGYTGLPSLVLIYGIVVVGFNLLLGYTGLLSFGHAAFFGTAAYAAAILSAQVPSPVVMVLFGTLVALIVAWPIGFVSIRRSGVYFAVLTLTFGQMFYFYALGPGAWLTNGDNGYSNIVIDGLFGLGAVPLDLSVPLLGNVTYVFVAVLTVFAVAVANRIIHSPYGLIFKALGENEQRVSFVGLNVFRYKHMAFIISAGYAGAGGALFVIHETYIHPTTGLYWITSGDFVIMTVLGGTGSLVGPMLGAFIFEYISNVISGLSLPLIGSIGSLWRIILGAVFVFIVWVFPRGVYGALRDVGTAVLEWLDDRAESGEGEEA